MPPVPVDGSGAYPHSSQRRSVTASIRSARSARRSTTAVAEAVSSVTASQLTTPMAETQALPLPCAVGGPAYERVSAGLDCCRRPRHGKRMNELLGDTHPYQQSAKISPPSAHHPARGAARARGRGRSHLRRPRPDRHEPEAARSSAGARRLSSGRHLRGDKTGSARPIAAGCPRHSG